MLSLKFSLNSLYVLYFEEVQKNIQVDDCFMTGIKSFKATPFLPLSKSIVTNHLAAKGGVTPNTSLTFFKSDLVSNSIRESDLQLYLLFSLSCINIANFVLLVCNKTTSILLFFESKSLSRINYPFLYKITIKI